MFTEGSFSHRCTVCGIETKYFSLPVASVQEKGNDYRVRVRVSNGIYNQTSTLLSKELDHLEFYPIVLVLSVQN